MVNKKTNLFGHTEGEEITQILNEDNPLPALLDGPKWLDSKLNPLTAPGPNDIISLVLSLGAQGVRGAWDGAVNMVSNIGKPTNIPEKPVNPADKSKGGHTV